MKRLKVCGNVLQMCQKVQNLSNSKPSKVQKHTKCRDRSIENTMERWQSVLLSRMITGEPSNVDHGEKHMIEIWFKTFG